MGNKLFSNFEDFILDESFKAYVLSSNQESIDFWNSWLVNNPDKAAEAEKARDVLRILLSARKIEANADKEEARRILLKKINQSEESLSQRRKIFQILFRVAAMIVLAAGLAFMWNMITRNRLLQQNQLKMNEVIVPVGEKSQVILSDGTHVWINSGSSFRYPVCFGKDSREVSLIGEAYFDVTRGSSTFTVNTHDARIKVLGTAFNVKSYPEDRKTQTTVVRGLVRVESRDKGIEAVLLGPSQTAIIKNNAKTTSDQSVEGLHVIDKVNTAVVTSWKDQMLIFADETFEDLAIKMERWYNIKITIHDDMLKKERYTGKFVNNETVYEVLEAIEVTTPIEYTVQGDEIIITGK